MDVHTVAIDPSTAAVPSVVSNSVKIHLFCCLCYETSVYISFENDLFTEVDLLLRFSISRVFFFP